MKAISKLLWSTNGKKTILSKPLAWVKIFSNKIRQPKPKPKFEKIWLQPKPLVIGSSLDTF
jgi:hypothetical protein